MPFIGTSILGFGLFRVGLFSGLIWAIVSYVLGLVGVYVLALIIDAWPAPSAHGAISETPWGRFLFADGGLGGRVFGIIPALGILGILGLYSTICCTPGSPR